MIPLDSPEKASEARETGCRWCHGPLPPKLRPGGRRREFCSVECRNALHGRRRWLQVERVRLVAELGYRREAVASARDKAAARSWVRSYERRIAELDGELACLEEGTCPPQH